MILKTENEEGKRLYELDGNNKDTVSWVTELIVKFKGDYLSAETFGREALCKIEPDDKGSIGIGDYRRWRPALCSPIERLIRISTLFRPTLKEALKDAMEEVGEVLEDNSEDEIPFDSKNKDEDIAEKMKKGRISLDILMYLISLEWGSEEFLARDLCLAWRNPRDTYSRQRFLRIENDKDLNYGLRQLMLKTDTIRRNTSPLALSPRKGHASPGKRGHKKEK
ncbi:hypothetical protein EJ08DRAFT_730843 [Tothia fuscella]|uniref:Uncharacterized protein n=1 Tax=Tothia fuscella TaxID=1048955 RepID=A0A9P4NYK1_9PEZI|nr:hypothetical protein EJ08DRAFT_730843 [Tothia fuscella]